MALIQYAAPWDRQPQEAVGVDWDNPLTNGLIFSSSLASGGGFRDEVGGLRPTINGTVAQGPTGDGTGAVFSGSDYLDFGASQIIPLGTPFTLTFYEEVTATSSYAAMLGLVAGSRQFLWIRGTSSYVCVLGVADGTTVVKFASMPAQFVGERIRFVLTGDAIDSNSGLRLWANGVEQTPAAGSFGTTSASSNKVGWDGADEKFQGRISDLHMLARRWSAEEVEAFFDAPQQLFTPQPIWVPVSAGGGTVTMAAQDAAHAHALDNAALSIGVTLTVADLAHGHALDASTLSTGTALAVADAQHAHALDNVTLSTTGATSLTVADLLHAHTLDAVVLTSQTDLAAADMAHGHALDGVTLTLGGISLVIAEIMHAHALDNVALTLDTYLAVADLLHAHTLDNVLVSIPGSALSDAEFRQMYDWISELHLVHGLRAGSPLTVTPTTRAAGIVDQTIGEVGTTVTVTRI